VRSVTLANEMASFA